MRAVINFIGSKTRSSTAVGHCIPYCYREILDVWEVMDDLTSFPKIAFGKVILSNVQIILHTL